MSPVAPAPSAWGRELVRLERRLLQRKPLRPEPGRVATVRVLAEQLRAGLRRLHQQRGLLPRIGVRDPGQHARDVRALQRVLAGRRDPPPYDGGIIGDGGYTPPPDGGCALYGQVCATASDCCYGLPCTNGRCETVIQ